MEAPLPMHQDPETLVLLRAQEDGAKQDILVKDSVSLPPASYWNLLRTHREYRLFLISFTVSHCGEWLNYVASMSVLEKGRDEISPQNRHLLISLLIVVRLLPNVFVAPFGGVLADTRDLRKSMMVLDAMGSVVALLFWVAYLFDSPLLVYAATLIQQILAGLYDPCRNAIVPQLVTDADYLHKATTMSGLAWSSMAAIGSSLGGVITSSLGIPACFVLDSLSYAMSATLLWQIHGTWNAAGIKNEPDHISTWWGQIVGMSVEGFEYVRSSPHGALVFIKGSGAIMFGASDVMNAAFAEVDDELQSERLGLLFACVGVGAFLGPLVTDRFVKMERLITVQRLCVLAFGVMAIGYLGIGVSGTFWETCLWTVLRASGMSISWIDSSLLIQKIMPPAVLGRVFAADTALATLGECVSAVYAGLLLDELDLTAKDIAFAQAFISFAFLLVWAVYHFKTNEILGECEKESSLEMADSEQGQ